MQRTKRHRMCDGDGEAFIMLLQGSLCTWRLPYSSHLKEATSLSAYDITTNVTNSNPTLITCGKEVKLKLELKSLYVVNHCFPLENIFKINKPQHSWPDVIESRTLIYSLASCQQLVSIQRSHLLSQQKGHRQQIPQKHKTGTYKCRHYHGFPGAPNLESKAVKSQVSPERKLLMKKLPDNFHQIFHRPEKTVWRKHLVRWRKCVLLLNSTAHATQLRCFHLARISMQFSLPRPHFYTAEILFRLRSWLSDQAKKIWLFQLKLICVRNTGYKKGLSFCRPRISRRSQRRSIKQVEWRRE